MHVIAMGSLQVGEVSVSDAAAESDHVIMPAFPLCHDLPAFQANVDKFGQKYSSNDILWGFYTKQELWRCTSECSDHSPDWFWSALLFTGILALEANLSGSDKTSATSCRPATLAKPLTMPAASYTLEDRNLLKLREGLKHERLLGCPQPLCNCHYKIVMVVPARLSSPITAQQQLLSCSRTAPRRSDAQASSCIGSHVKAYSQSAADISPLSSQEANILSLQIHFAYINSKNLKIKAFRVCLVGDSYAQDALCVLGTASDWQLHQLLLWHLLSTKCIDRGWIALAPLQTAHLARTHVLVALQIPNCNSCVVVYMSANRKIHLCSRDTCTPARLFTSSPMPTVSLVD